MNLNCTECRWHKEDTSQKRVKCPECGGEVEVTKKDE